MIGSIRTDENWESPRYSSAVLSLHQSVQLYRVPVRKVVRQMQSA